MYFQQIGVSVYSRISSLDCIKMMVKIWIKLFWVLFM